MNTGSLAEAGVVQVLMNNKGARAGELDEASFLCCPEDARCGESHCV